MVKVVRNVQKKHTESENETFQNMNIINDYSEDESYYTQGFELDGVVSIWVGLKDGEDDLVKFDVLQDLCGVGYYVLSNQESNCFDYNRVSLKKLLDEMSYSNSFINEALKVAKKKGFSEGVWVILQYDFDYNPEKVERKIAKKPVFLGSFNYTAS